MSRILGASLVLALLLAVMGSDTLSRRGSTAYASPTNGIFLTKSSCLALLTAAKGPAGPGLECGILGGVSSFNGNLATIAQYTGDKDGVPEYPDFAQLDLDGNQLHEGDGLAFIMAFVDTKAPIQFLIDDGIPMGGGTLETPSGTPVTGPAFVCATASVDADCDPASAGGDGIVVIAICGGSASGDSGCANSQTATRGPHKISIVQNQVPFDISYTIVGDAKTIQLTPLETTIAAGIQDLNGDGKLSAANECPLAADVAGFTKALGQAEKTVVFARVADDSGQNITGAWVHWDTDNHNIAMFATDLTPTLDLGTFGFGAPQIVCGTNLAGVASMMGTLLKGPAGIPLDALAADVATATPITVKGVPVTLAVQSTSGSCDGASGPTVTATVSDSSGGSVADGTAVHFGAGSAAPAVDATTSNGVASATIVAAAGTVGDIPVTVTTGTLQQPATLSQAATASCVLGAAVTPTVGPGGVSPIPIGITPPGTGTGGSAGSSGASGWALLALFGAGTVILAGARLAMKRT